MISWWLSPTQIAPTLTSLLLAQMARLRWQRLVLKDFPKSFPRYWTLWTCLASLCRLWTRVTWSRSLHGTRPLVIVFQSGPVSLKPCFQLLATRRCTRHAVASTSHTITVVKVPQPRTISIKWRSLFFRTLMYRAELQLMNCHGTRSNTRYHLLRQRSFAIRTHLWWLNWLTSNERWLIKYKIWWSLQ